MRTKCAPRRSIHKGEPRRIFCCGYPTLSATSCGGRRQREDVNASLCRRPLTNSLPANQLFL
uniref:Uncharacterized protein n=1 Tax=Hyaloperonospora arabidopsidis (strain Emoy2) TaxID=559515 RepID=M4BS92_HYAAE